MSKFKCPYHTFDCGNYTSPWELKVKVYLCKMCFDDLRNSTFTMGRDDKHS